MAKNKAEQQIRHDKYLDATGLNCPLPILKTKVLLNQMSPGEILFVEASDPHSAIDFKAYCARTNHRLLHSHATEDGLF